jgi:hypothetical protein
MWNCYIKEINRRYSMIKRKKESKNKKISNRKAFAVNVVRAIVRVVQILTQIFTNLCGKQKIEFSSSISCSKTPYVTEYTFLILHLL